jgi:hypothetical protein
MEYLKFVMKYATSSFLWWQVYRTAKYEAQVGNNKPVDWSEFAFEFH